MPEGPPETERYTDWVSQRSMEKGPHSRTARFERAAKAISIAILRNRALEEGGSGLPVLVEGKRDEATLRALGFTGKVERVNRGWDRPRLVAYLHSSYCTVSDGGPSLILLMDWDRTGGRLQTAIRDRLMALDSPVDEDLRRELLKSMKPEGRTVESLLSHADSLEPLVRGFLHDLG
jgi:5S rRNA maturation endonuclease (ribonuclease M5)